MPHRIEVRVRRAQRRAEEARRDRAHRDRPQPPVFCNSIQKAGTHLVVGLVGELPGLDVYGAKTYWHHFNRAATGKEPVGTVERVVEDLGRLRRGEVMRGHVEHHPAIAAALDAHDIRHLLIVRDPRDVVVSLLHWWRDRADIDTWVYRYFATLGDDEARLRFLIDGWPTDPPDGFPRDVDYPDLGARMAAYLGWFDEPSCHVVRFEDLRGPEWEDAYRSVAAFVAPEVPVDEALALMRRGADPSRSKTFRSGTSGGWRTAVPEAMQPRLEEVLAPVLGPLGYA